MKFKYILASCCLGAGLLTTSCADEFKDINSQQKDIPNPDIRFLFTQCLYEFEPMDYYAWFRDIYRMARWSQCTVATSGNTDDFNLITEQGSVGSHVYDVLRMVRDVNFRIDQLDDTEKAQYEYIKYLCNPLVVFLAMNDSDMYGDMQYSEAEMARYTNPPLLLPKFDTQEDLYKTWLEQLDDTVEYLTTNKNKIKDVLGTQDFIYNGDLEKWAKLANSLKLKIAARLVNKDRQRAINIVNEVTSSQAGMLSSAEDDFVYNRGKNDNHWNNDFNNEAGHDKLIDFMKKHKDTRLLSAFTKNEFNGPVIQAFLDQNKKLPKYIEDNAEIQNGEFKGWKSTSPGEPWVRYYGAPLEIGAGNDTDYEYIFDPTGTLLRLETSAGGNRNYRPISYRNQELVKGIYDFTYPDAPDITPDKDVTSTPWYGIYFSAAEVELLLAEFKLLGANTPSSAQEHLKNGAKLSAYVYDRAAELNKVPYYSRTCVNDPNDKTIKITDAMVTEMLQSNVFTLNGSLKENLEKVYIQQYIHYIMNPIDQFVNVRRSGVPTKGSSILSWQDFNNQLDYAKLIPRRFKVSEPAPTDKLHDIKVKAYEAQGFSYGTEAADPTVLNTERVWIDKDNPQFGEGPKVQ